MQTFHSARLLYRTLQSADQGLYCACYTDPILMQLIAEPLTTAAALRSFSAAVKINSEYPIRRRTWVIQEKKSGHDIGLVALVCDKAKPEPQTGELGVILFASFQNQGYSTEATNTAVDIAFGKASLAALFVHHTSQNVAVSRVMQKLGFQREMTGAENQADEHWVLARSHWQALRTQQAKNDYNASGVPIR